MNNSTLCLFGRRTFLALAVALAAVPAVARDIVDATGRTVSVPDNPSRVFAAGPPASVLLYALKPEAMIGWSREPTDNDKPFLLPAVRDLPALGRLTGKGDTLNLEVLVAAKPDLIIDFGTVSETYKSLAEGIQTETGIPYVLIDGSFANTPAALRQLGDVLGVHDRGEELAAYAEKTLSEANQVLAKVPEADRPTVYLARTKTGLETAGTGSINAEIIEQAGGRNVVQGGGKGLATASPEQIIGWAPQVIVTIDRDFAQSVGAMPEWKDIPAVANHRVILAPVNPFAFIDSPPSVNRLIGLQFLQHAFFPEQATGDLNKEVSDFYQLFYHVRPDDAAVAKLLGQ